MIDKWDAVGAASAGLVGAGVCRLAGWPWAAIYFGAVLGALYVLHELQAARATARRRREND
jgi:hypothetical protein